MSYSNRFTGPYEVTVRYVQSERETFNPAYSPPYSTSSTRTSEVGTRVLPFEANTFSTVPNPITPERPQAQKIVVYECVDYRVENGCLIITEKLGSLEGFLIPLTVIQEIKVNRKKLERDISKDFNFTERLKD